MQGWRQVLELVTSNVEELFDALKRRLAQRLGGDEPIQIVPYRGYGTAAEIYLRGRVLEAPGTILTQDNDSLWDNLLNMYRRFQSDEVPGARVRARFQGVEHEAVTDHEGYFEFLLAPPGPLPSGDEWYTVELELLEPLRPGQDPVRATAQVLVPPPGAQFGVISDIDDTVLQSDVTNRLRMARTVFLGNARTRLPFEGVAALYRALRAGSSGSGLNPIFYVSSSPWNLYDLLEEFFQIQRIPLGPLFLRDWGLSGSEVPGRGHRGHKLAAIQRILDRYSTLPFILIGDSGQEDPEIYHEVVRTHPDRICAIYIRNILRKPERIEAIQALAKEVIAAGSTLVLADDTLGVARHALEQTWIAPELLPEVEAEKEADEAPPSPIETLLGQGAEEPGPTVVVGEQAEDTTAAVEAGAIEQALETGDKKKEAPPTVIVEGEKQQE